MRKLLLATTALAVALAGPGMAQSPCTPGTAIVGQPPAAALAG